MACRRPCPCPCSGCCMAPAPAPLNDARVSCPCHQSFTHLFVGPPAKVNTTTDTVALRPDVHTRCRHNGPFSFFSSTLPKPSYPRILSPNRATTTASTNPAPPQGNHLVDLLNITYIVHIPLPFCRYSLCQPRASCALRVTF